MLVKFRCTRPANRPNLFHAAYSKERTNSEPKAMLGALRTHFYGRISKPTHQKQVNLLRDANNSCQVI